MCHLQPDPKEVARVKARAAAAEAKALAIKKETRGMKKMSSFFAKRPPLKAKN